MLARFRRILARSLRGPGRSIGAGFRGLRAGAAIGAAVDRVGDGGMAASAWMLRNPAPSIAILTAFLFALVRLSIESFYGSLGVQPEDVGLDSVQGTLQGSALILVLVIAISVAYGAGIVVVGSVVFGAHALIRGLLFGGRSKGYLWRGVRRGLRLGPTLVPLVCVPLATVVLVLESHEDLDAIRSGKAIDNPLTPWRA